MTWDITKCRRTQEIVEPGNDPVKVTTDLAYDNFGNVSSASVWAPPLSRELHPRAM